MMKSHALLGKIVLAVCLFGLFLFGFIHIDTTAAYAEASATDRLLIFNQNCGNAAGGYNDGQQECRKLELATGSSSNWMGYWYSGQPLDTNSGCGIYAMAHAYQWLTGDKRTTSNAADLLRMFINNNISSNLDISSNAPWRGSLDDKYGTILVNNFGVNRTNKPSNEDEWLALFRSGGAAVLYIPGHYICAVGALSSSETENGELWLHIVDSSCGSTFKRLTAAGACAYGFVGHGMITSSDGNGFWRGDEYYISLSSFNKANMSVVKAYLPPVKKGEEMPTGYDRTIPDGDYIIAMATNPLYYIDIDGADYPASNNTNVSLCQAASLDGIPAFDIWTVTYNSSTKFYTIKQKDTDMCLDVAGDGLAECRNVQAYSSSGQYASPKTSNWAISLNGRNGYRLQARSSGFSLDVNGGMANGANIQQYTGHDGDNQSWIFIPYMPPQPIENGRYLILSAMDTGYEIDIPGDTGDVEDLANVQIWDIGAQSRYNSFDITKLDNGYYKIIHVASGKSLDVNNGGSAYGQNIGLYGYHGGTTEQWAITPNGSGYVLRPRCSGYALDAATSTASNGVNVYQYPHHGGANQTWVFIQAEFTVSYDANGGEGAPGNQTKYRYAWDTRLSETVPTREGYNFKYWATDAEDVSEGTTIYHPGDVYSADADLQLYAMWENARTMQSPDFILPASLTVIEPEAFMGLAMSVVALPEGLEEIGEDAFRNCANLTEVYIPASVANIENDVFQGCAEDLTIFGHANTVAQVFAQINGYAFVEVADTEPEWSDWVMEDQLPSGTMQKETKQQYRYQDKVYSEWSDWGPRTTNRESTGELKKERQLTEHYWYYDLCQNCGRHSPYTVCWDCGYSIGANWRVTWLDTSRSEGGQFGNSDKIFTMTDEGRWFYWTDDNGNGDARTVYQYATRTSAWSDWSEWSDDYVAANDTRNVESRNIYRYKLP